MEVDHKSQEEAEQSVYDCTNSFMTVKIPSINGWFDQESPELRTALGKTAKKETMVWFKRQDYGEMMGNVIMAHYGELTEGCRLKEEIDNISNWMDT